MIPFFFRRDEIREFPDLSQRKKNKVRMKIDERFGEQDRILVDRIAMAKREAKVSGRALRRGRGAIAREAMHSFKQALITSQPVLNAYVGTSLQKHFYDLMSIEGFEFPDMLTELRDDIDFGLFAIQAMDELEVILKSEVDPLKELGIDLSDFDD